VINIDWYHNLTSFPSYCRLLVKFALLRGVSLFNTLVRDKLLIISTTTFGPKKLETWLYRMVQQVFRYLEPFRRGSRLWRTNVKRRDRQTDRTVVSIAWFNEYDKIVILVFLPYAWFHVFKHCTLCLKNETRFHFYLTLNLTSLFDQQVKQRASYRVLFRPTHSFVSEKRLCSAVMCANISFLRKYKYNQTNKFTFSH